MSRLLPTLVALHVLCGCLPIPHRMRITPEIWGSVASAPEGSRVVLSTSIDDEMCAKPDETAMTDPARGFIFAPQTRFQLFASMVDRVYPVRICLVDKDKSELLLHRNYFVGLPHSVGLTCDLSRPRSSMCLLDQRPVPPWNSEERLTEFLSLPVETRLKQAIARGDSRLLALFGWRTSVPGLPEREWQSGEIQMINGTSDTLPDSLSEQVREYARTYNLGIIAARPQ